MRRLAVPALLSAAVMVPTAASAAWSATGSGTSPVSATTMTNASGFSAACASKSVVVTLTWTISPDPFVERYEIVRSGGGGGTTILVPRADSTVTDDPPPGTAKVPNKYSYTIRSSSTAHAWVTPSLASTTTVSLTNNGCTFS